MAGPARGTVGRDAMWRTRLEWLPLIVRPPAPGPRMARFFETSSSPLVSLMVDDAGSENLMVSPAREFLSTARNEPVPLSAAEVTVRVAARRLAAIAINKARHAA